MNNPITPISNAASLKNGIRSCVSIEEEAIDTSHPPITIAPNDWAKNLYLLLSPSELCFLSFK